MALTDPQLIELIACPDCRSDLAQAEGRLLCTGCGRQYEVRSGIPILYPTGVEAAHLEEEERLAKAMMQPRGGGREAFYADQWGLARAGFWKMVEDNVVAPPAAIVNIGCGYSRNFLGFQQLGYTFVNLDLVYSILRVLQEERGAKSCVAGDIERLPLKPSSFDALICADVIHHRCDIAPDLLASFSELLRPGGSLFLQDPNAWGMFQIPKSILPKPLYRAARATYHRLKRTKNRPADYEFPTSVWSVMRTLRKVGFSVVELFPNDAYPRLHPLLYGIYRFLRRVEYVRRYHGYHYTLRAVKG